MKIKLLSLIFIAIITTSCKSTQQKDLKKHKSNFTEKDLTHLEHCLVLAEDALEAGDQPFGSILVNAENKVIAQARNRVNTQTVLAHPEIELAHWAAENLSVKERKNTTMYTSGEHCTMCSAAHGWVGIGKLVYLSSGEQLNEWLKEFGLEPAPIKFIPSEEIIKKVEIKGPAKGRLIKEIKSLHKAYYQG
jgi:tRNA(Arg) A34 adenosine deaminase TadA